MSKHSLHFIGNAHLDPIWLWRWQEGFAEVKATFQSAIDRMKEYPDFVFTCSSAQYYKWAEENCPEMFEEIKKFVANGQWQITGGWWVQADTNIPSGEALARHGLYSQRYYLEKFGVMCRVGYNVDSFGHSIGLPQILKKSGMDFYVFKNPGKKEFPYLFDWVGADGTSVTTFRIPDQYMSWDGYLHWNKNPRGTELRHKAERAFNIANEIGGDMMCFYGVGNHGGGPTIAHIETILELQKEHGKDAVKFSAPEQFFDAVSGQELPVYDRELNHAANGGYSANANLKSNNRKSEHRLLEAEKYNVMAHMLVGCELKTAELRAAWENVMLIHFHDAICGVSIKPAYPDIYEFYGESLSAAGKAMNHSLQKISWAVETQRSPEIRKDKDEDLRLWEKEGLGAPVVVFNSLGWDYEGPLEVNKTVRRAEDGSGASLEIQHVRGCHHQVDFDSWHTVFDVKVPALGYATYWIYRDWEKPLAAPETSGVDPFVLENGLVRIEFEKHSGFIKRYFDKVTETELTRGKSAVPLVIDEYYANNWGGDFSDVSARFSDAVFEVLETGSIRKRVRVTSFYNKSEVRQDFILHEGSKDIEVRGRVMWQERHKMLKIAYSLNAEETEAAFDVPYAAAVKPTDGGEQCGGQWMQVYGNQNGQPASLAIINDSKYGHEAIGGELRMTIVRSPIHSDGGPESRHGFFEYTDQGLFEFKYAVIPGAGTANRAEVIRKAYQLNVPPQQVIETYHAGPLAQNSRGVCVSAENIAVTALKESEDGNAFILRCCETCGTETETKIDLPLLGRKLNFRIKKYEIKTFYLPKNGGEARECNLIEM